MDNVSHEIWKSIDGCVKYEVSNMGNIRNAKTKRLRKLGWKHGYRRINLWCDDGVERHFAVHRLVATAFIPNPENKATVNHINAIRHDNRVENLEWMTNAENIQYAIDLGHMDNPPEHEPYNTYDKPKAFLRKSEIASQAEYEYLLEKSEASGKSLYKFIKEQEDRANDLERQIEEILDEADDVSVVLCKKIMHMHNLLQQRYIIDSDAVGKRYGMLTVIGHGRAEGQSYKICRCDCGKITLVQSGALCRGATKSCGCYGQQIRNKKYSGNTHPKLRAYWGNHHRNVKWPDKWQNFEDFAEWSLENGYEEGYRLMRRDPVGEYSADNCYWAEPQKAKPKPEPKPKALYEYNGEQLTLTELAKKTGIRQQTLSYRMSRGMSVEDAVNTPLCANGRPRNNVLPC